MEDGIVQLFQADIIMNAIKLSAESWQKVST